MRDRLDSTSSFYLLLTTQSVRRAGQVKMFPLCCCTLFVFTLLEFAHLKCKCILCEHIHASLPLFAMPKSLSGQKKFLAFPKSIFWDNSWIHTVSFETASGPSWLEHHTSILAEHLRMMTTAGQNPRPRFSEGSMSEVSGWPTHLPVWHYHMKYRLHVCNGAACFVGVWAETGCVHGLLRCILYIDIIAERASGLCHCRWFDKQCFDGGKVTVMYVKKNLWTIKVWEVSIVKSHV